MIEVRLLNGDELDRSVQERFLEKRGLKVVRDRGSSVKVVICDLTSGVERAPDPGDGLLLVLRRGEKERFRLELHAGGKLRVLGESDAKRELLDLCCDEAERAEETLARMGGGLLSRLTAGLAKLIGGHGS